MYTGISKNAEGYFLNNFSDLEAIPTDIIFYQPPHNSFSKLKIDSTFRLHWSKPWGYLEPAYLIAYNQNEMIERINNPTIEEVLTYLNKSFKNEELFFANRRITYLEGRLKEHMKDFADYRKEKETEIEELLLKVKEQKKLIKNYKG